jgi:hypothetical protein
MHDRRHFSDNDTFESDARSQILFKMLEIAGFPSKSDAFARLARQAIEQIGERDRMGYMDYLTS